MKRVARLTTLTMLVLVLVFESCEISVKDPDKHDARIAWANPNPILEGTPLSGIQLNASANVPGTFAYTPGPGTILDAGDQELRVDFTPADQNIFNSVSKTVKITVLAPNPVDGVSSAEFNNNRTYGTVTDLDGNVYKTIIIGSQTWMAENLRTTRFLNGDIIPEVRDSAGWNALTTPAFCNYNNTDDGDSIATFGRLYNRKVVDDPRQIAPGGWHVPSRVDWDILIKHLGGELVAGSKLKEQGFTHWPPVSITSDNSSGFTALPSGSRSNGEFKDLGNTGYWWNSKSNGSLGYGGHLLFPHENKVYWFNNADIDGHAIRCVKND